MYTYLIEFIKTLMKKSSYSYMTKDLRLLNLSKNNSTNYYYITI